MILLSLASTILVGCTSGPRCPSRLDVGLVIGASAVGAPALATVVGKRTEDEMMQKRMTVDLKALGDQTVPSQAKIRTNPTDPTAGIASFTGADESRAAPGSKFLIYLNKAGEATLVLPVDDEAAARALDARIRTPGCSLWKAG